MDKEELDKIITTTENNFKSFCKNNNIKIGTKTFYKFQHAYFNGAISVIGEVPARWGVNLMSNRPIIESYV